MQITVLLGLYLRGVYKVKVNCWAKWGTLSANLNAWNKNNTFIGKVEFVSEILDLWKNKYW